MEIIKKLVLNKTPKDAPNGGIACAMNMMVDDTGSFLSNDIGLSKRFWCTNDNERIVGVIPTNKEIVIFTYDGSNSRIYRLEDGQTTLPIEGSEGGNLPYECPTSWEWEGGKITGSYTYNYKGDLIIAVGEYNSNSVNKVPLKSFNLDEAAKPGVKELKFSYNIEENIPTCECNYSINNNGSLVCGTYTFFIRYKLETDNYTKWFQITTDIHIVELIEGTPYYHKYLKADGKGFAEPASLTAIETNGNGLSNKGLTLHFTFGKTSFKELELGYIIKRKTDIQGRIIGLYEINHINDNESILNIPVTNNNFSDEVGINELIENPHQFYNVENVVNYNNRLYIANYDEYDNIDYSTLSKTVLVTVANDTSETSISANVSPGVSIYEVQYNLYNITYRSNGSVQTGGLHTVPIYRCMVNNDTNVLINKSDILSVLKTYIYLNAVDVGTRYYLNGTLTDKHGYDVNSSQTRLNTYLIVQNPNVANDYICIASHIANNDIDVSSLCNWNLDIPEYDIVFQDGELQIVSNNKSYSLTGENATLCVLGLGYDATFNEGVYYLGNGYANYTRINFDSPKVLSKCVKILLQNYRLIDTTIEEPTEDDGTINYHGVDSGLITVNTRTLHPYQKYNFFIHYLRPDGSATNGFLINNFKYTVAEGNLIIPAFKVTNIPTEENFVGYFISYEEVERNVESVLITYNDDNILIATNAEYIYDLNSFRGKILYTSSEGSPSYTIVSQQIKYLEDRLNYNRIKVNTQEAIGTGIGYFYRDIENQYINKSKTLYRLTKNIYDWNNYVQDGDYLPDYYNTQHILRFIGDDKLFIIDPNVEYVFDDKGNKVTYTPLWVNPVMYSQFPTIAMSIKQDVFRVATTILYDDDNNDETPKKSELVINTLITPSTLHDFLELPENYRIHPSKIYVNYRKDNISRFDKTVYRSDVISDESLENRFRHFGVNQYKNILENKGKITNLVGIGFYFIVHTEYSMFVFDRSPKMTQKVQLDIPDTFDIDYQEVMPSNEGFGGLKDKDESIVSKHGYIWYDKTNSVIFTFINGQAGQLSSDITNYLKYRNVETVRFAEDIKHDRLIICCRTTDNKYFTLSYSFVTNSFISLHNYKFTNNFRTYSTSYIFDEDKDNKTLYTFDDSLISRYDNLTLGDNEGLKLFDYYVLREDENRNKNIASYVDIIFNEAYEVPKVLNAINYILSTFNSNEIDYLPSIRDEKPLRLYSGDIIRIYTDEADTMNMNVSIENKDLNDTRVTNVIYGLKPYTLPAWNKGRWVLNYFRNVRIKDETGKDITYNAADDKTLIYGKYFIIRFVFNNDKKVKLDNVDINTQIY